MMKRIILLFLPLIIFADDNGNSSFENLKARIQTELVDISEEVSGIARLARAGHNNLDMVQSQDPNVTGPVVAAQANFSQILAATDDIHTMLTTAMSMVSQLNEPQASEPIDYSSALARLESYLNAVYNNTLQINSKVGYANTQLQTIINILNDLDLSGSSDLINLLTQIKNILNDHLKPLLQWMNDQNGVFQSFYSNAVHRIQFLDANVETDLAAMWRDTLYNMSNLINRTYDEFGHGHIEYSLSDQLENVDIGSDFRLSNEGYIQLQNLAFNQRQYLCSVEALEMMRGMTNNANLELTWVTNYLSQIQSPYYSSFLREFLSSPSSVVSPWNTSNFLVVTNFFLNISTPRNGTNRYRSYRERYTNWFDRVENYLIALNGGFSSPIPDYDVIDDNLDQDNIDRWISYSTNDLLNAVGEYAGVSNFFNSASSAFLGLMNSWSIGDDQGGNSPIRILPSFELGGIQFDHIDLTTSHFASLSEACRIVFTGIWYLVWGSLAFKFLVFTVFLLGKTIARICLLISVFLH